MQILRDTSAMKDFLQKISSQLLAQELTARLVDLDEYDCDYGDLLHIVVLDHASSMEDVNAACGFSPLINRFDGKAFGAAGFTPGWEECIVLDDWHLAVYVTRDDGFGYFLLIPSDIGNQKLQAMLSQFASLGVPT